MITEEKELVTCDICGKECQSRGLKTHKLFAHPTEKLVCKKCNQEFNNLHELAVHARKMHIRARVCETCSSSYIPTNTKQKFCSNECYENSIDKAEHNKRFAERNRIIIPLRWENSTLEQRKEWVRGIAGCRKGVKVSDETITKLVASHLGKVNPPESYVKSVETRAKTTLKNGYYHSPDTCKKLSNTMQRNLNNPEFVEKVINSSKKGCWVSGKYESAKNGCIINFGSSYELLMFMNFEKDNNILNYSKCKFGIFYTLNGETSRYFPDMFIKNVDGTVTIAEIKPKALLTHPMNVAKLLALSEYCKDNGFNYQVYTQEDILQSVSMDEALNLNGVTFSKNKEEKYISGVKHLYAIK